MLPAYEAIFNAYSNSTYQLEIQQIGVIFWKRLEHSEGHTIGEDGNEDDNFERSVNAIKENYSQSNDPP